MGSKRARSPIWLTTSIVVIMVLLFSVMVYVTREKEMGDQFNLQQLTVIKGSAGSVEDIFADIERSITIHCRYASLQNERNIRMVYDDLGLRVDFIAVESKTGQPPIIYPQSYFKEFKDNPELSSIVRKTRETEKTVIGDLAPASRKRQSKAPCNIDPTLQYSK